MKESYENLETLECDSEVTKNLTSKTKLVRIQHLVFTDDFSLPLKNEPDNKEP